MLYSLKRHPIILYFEKNHDTVTSVANDYLESTQESPTGKIAEALEDPSLSAFHRLKSFSKFQVQITKRTGR